jgi:hypothetical protein
MSGWQSQQTGDLGEGVVVAALQRAGFLVGRLTPDPGEDLWAELDGRRSIAEGHFPLRALIQVRATADDTAELVLDVDIDQIKRWAAQPLPVFLVGVSTPTEKLFTKSIDNIVSDDLGGKDPFEMKTKTARVRLHSPEDLGLTLRAAMHQHYASSQLTLEDVPDSEIKNHYFEVLTRRNPESGVSIPTAIWAILWKSPPRPQHFAAMVTELITQGRWQYERSDPRPMLFFFNIFRSLEDRHNNVAAVRIHVVNPDHPNAETLRQQLDMPGGYKVTRERDVAESRQYFESIAMSPEVFRDYAKEVGPQLDALANEVLARARNGVQIWDDGLIGKFNAAKALWNNETVAPAECRMLEAVLEEQFECLLEHGVTWRNTRNQFAPAMRASLLRELEIKLQQCVESWAVVLRAER